jgi:hypothetical protein
MSIVLKNQVEASEKSADELESELQRHHKRAMLCYDVQDLMKSVVSLLANINEDVERWQHDMVSGSDELRKEIDRFGESWDSLYRRLEGIFGKVFGLVGAMEETGFTVEGKRAFLVAWKELRGIICFPRDRVIAASEQVRRGEVRPLGEITRELWDRPVA